VLAAGTSAYRCFEMAAIDGPHSTEHLFSDDRVHAPIAVGDLGDTEIDTE
jgi:hypothetical protein